MANNIIYPYGVGGQTPSGVGLNMGSFAEAYDMSKTNNYVFGWFLQDEDEDGNEVTKMIWHIGNRKFVDAIGAEVDGVRDGVTIRSSGAGVISLKGPSSLGLNTNSADFNYIDGVVNYSFEEIAERIKEANSSSADYDGDVFSVVSVSTAPDTFDVDFGGAKVSSLGSPTAYTSIKRLDITNIGGYQFLYNISGLRLKSLQLCGTIGGTVQRLLYRMPTSLTKLDLSQLTCKPSGDTARFSESITSENLKTSIEVLDLRGFDTSSAKSMETTLRNMKVGTLIIGNFSTSSCESLSNFMYGVTGVTLVCTQDTPPVIKSGYNFLGTASGTPANDRFSVIKVPDKTVEVNGEEVTVLSLYQAASGWSDHADKMETYEEGEY